MNESMDLLIGQFTNPFTNPSTTQMTIFRSLK